MPETDPLEIRQKQTVALFRSFVAAIHHVGCLTPGKAALVAEAALPENTSVENRLAVFGIDEPVSPIDVAAWPILSQSQTLDAAGNPFEGILPPRIVVALFRSLAYSCYENGNKRENNVAEIARKAIPFSRPDLIEICYGVERVDGMTIRVWGQSLKWGDE